ncbi:MAG: hypothetical protein R3345_15110 [Fulvivirga sp.]|nr:hypothetical protein [Fulvivirga sp.]
MRYFVLLFIFIASGCTSTQRLIVNQDAPLNRLGIHLTFAQELPSELKSSFLEHLDYAIMKHNANSRSKFQLYQTNSTDSSALHMHVSALKLVSKKEQGTAVAVSMIGFAMPFVMVSAGSPFYLAFWYFPKTQSLVQLSLSGEIEGQPGQRIERVHYNSGFLRNPMVQIEKHSAKFQDFVARTVKEIERAYY